MNVARTYSTYPLVLNQARMSGIDLSAQVKNKHVTGAGRPVVYLTFGAAVSEVSGVLL